MVKIILIKKTGELVQKNVKSLEDDTLLYKKCGFQSATDFSLQHTFKVKNKYSKFMYALYAKTSGKAGYENKYELPPPIDKELYFNTMCIIKLCKDSEDVLKILDLTDSEWSEVYEQLFGGFENLSDTSSDEEDELEDIPDEMLTEEGYLKDDFVVDNDDSDDEYDSELEEDEYTDSESDSNTE